MSRSPSFVLLVTPILELGSMLSVILKTHELVVNDRDLAADVGVAGGT